MTTAIDTPAAPKWQAGIEERRIYVKRLIEEADGETKVSSMPLKLFNVVLVRGEGERINFYVTWPKGRLTFSDTRECLTGTAGSSGQWATRPTSKPGKRRSLTPTAWKAEVSRLIGTERAEEIIRILMPGRPLF